MVTAAMLTLAAACSRGSDSTTALSGSEQRQLNEAAEMLDANSVALEDVTDNNATAAPEPTRY